MPLLYPIPFLKLTQEANLIARVGGQPIFGSLEDSPGALKVNETRSVAVPFLDANERQLGVKDQLLSGAVGVKGQRLG